MLTLNQKEILTSFNKTTEAIKVLYNKLKELEKNGQKDSEEFRKTIDYLDICLEVEDSKYGTQIDTSNLERIFEHIDSQFVKSVTVNFKNKGDGSPALFLVL